MTIHRPHSIRSIIGIVIFILLFGGGVVAALYNAKVENKTAPKITTFFDSYFARLEAREFDQAWESQTSPHYKEQYPSTLYLKMWRDRLRDYGSIVKHDVVRLDRTFRIGRSNGWTVVVDYIFERQPTKTNKVVTYYVVEDTSGALKIDLSSLTSGLQSDRSWPEPW